MKTSNVDGRAQNKADVDYFHTAPTEQEPDALLRIDFSAPPSKNVFFMHNGSMSNEYWHRRRLMTQKDLDIGNMTFKRLRTCEGEPYSRAMESYAISFPFHEQREAASQVKIMGNEEYHFNVIYDDDEMVGIILWWETENHIYVEHFCILPQMRNRKYGLKTLAALNRIGKTIILEIDPPVDETSLHRKAFYEKAGYKANDFAHVHPPYHEGYDGHRLVVMSCPGCLSETEYDKFNAYLNNTVMASALPVHEPA